MASSIFSNYINGAWVEGASSIVNRSPADTEDVVGRYAQADADQVDRAIAAAAAAQPAWARSGLEERWRVLMAIGDELIARKAELGEQLSREEGKTLAEGVGEVHRSGQFFHYYAAEVLRQLARRRTPCVRAWKSRCAASRSAWSPSSRRGISRWPRRPGRSRRRWPLATRSCSSPPTPCLPAPGR